ncbi:hypothetical protein E2542_SST18848 [Spatholobus suberectus]|nr:hypothetical protein E2542_SST18848 [Spatholobus suberectus]
MVEYRDSPYLAASPLELELPPLVSTPQPQQIRPRGQDGQSNPSTANRRFFVSGHRRLGFRRVSVQGSKLD